MMLLLSGQILTSDYRLRFMIERLGISHAITPGFAIISPTDKVHVLFTASMTMLFLNYQS